MSAALLCLHGALALGGGQLRVWSAGYDGEREMRQLLVACSGQKPNLWLSWYNVRNILLRGGDHAIIAACAPPAPPTG